MLVQSLLESEVTTLSTNINIKLCEAERLYYSISSILQLCSPFSSFNDFHVSAQVQILELVTSADRESGEGTSMSLAPLASRVT